ncbi:RNA pseudouridine synthase [Luteolibacter sp. GHJ8]|uniref:RNA pseudouridine synthase n=1 Tax=Luteolibacter rhizosphaerae TaxID=2989719 RepID=A0ABT3FYV8_9BACT|nr:RNA pseudouridine synthase [Luteolibacter rhizosphaerae]MCW1912753.1 RNA pseudouridine synthase [Luteolibacter rhizosphaerae]
MRAVCEFRVIDESEDWIVVDKPAPLAVHPANGKVEPTLLGGLEELLLYERANGARLSILTRLDRETSGLVLVAKNAAAARHFSLQFQDRAVKKEYLALVHGWPEWESLRVEASIIRAGGAIWLRQAVDPAGRDCVTGFQVEKRFSNALGRFARVRCFPETGRMHQIRVHIEHAGHPLVGDKIYGTDGTPYLEQFAGQISDESVARLILPRHALHACKLSIGWQGRMLEWDSPLPGDLASFASG